MYKKILFHILVWVVLLIISGLVVGTDAGAAGLFMWLSIDGLV